jgi:thymidylate kinase
MSVKKPFILFITGISTSGKTTHYEAILNDKKYEEISMHDIDENGVPDVGREYWRKYRVQELYYNATKDYKEGRSSILCGISKPHEIHEFEFAKPEINVHFLLLDLSMETFEKRINERVKKQGAEDIIDVPEILLLTKRLKRSLLNSVSALKNGYVLETDNLSEEEMLSEGLKIVDSLLHPQ